MTRHRKLVSAFPIAVFLKASDRHVRTIESQTSIYTENWLSK